MLNLLIRLSQILYALCLSYYSNTEVFLFACLSSGWATTTSSLLGSKVGNNIKCLSQRQSDALLYRELNQGFASFRFQFLFSISLLKII